jgi:pimeloyl-ACP methyl ester carboxylesterase
MTRKAFLLFLTLSLSISALLFSQSKESAFKRGEGTIEFTGYKPLQDKPITIHYYVPTRGNIQRMRVLFSMHGAERSGQIQLNVWRGFAEDFGFIVLAPEYSKEHYKENDYQFGGISESHDEFILRPEEQWTYKTIEAIFDYLKTETGNQSEKYDMFGHSAGGQFVHRYLLATPEARVRKAVAANPGSWTFVLAEGLTDAKGVTHGWPYSIKDTPFTSDEYLKPFFNRELIVQVGTADTVQVGPYIPSSDVARAQGSMRHERGWNFFQQSQIEALKRATPFNWRIVDVEGVGHSSVQMVHGKGQVRSFRRNQQRHNNINDITNMGAYSLLFEQ